MAEEVQPKTRTWVRVLLIVSLSLNLLIVGIAAGSVYRLKGAREAGPPPSVGMMLFRELSREDRRALRSDAQQRNSGFREARLKEGAAVMEALRATPFDRDALQGVLEMQAVDREAFQRRIQAAWLSRVDEMSDEERAAYADRLQERMSRDHKRKKK